jgi:hypothetical protein
LYHLALGRRACLRRDLAHTAKRTRFVFEKTNVVHVGPLVNHREHIAVASKRDATDHAKVGMKALSRQSARVAVGNSVDRFALMASCMAGVAPWRSGASFRHALRSGLVQGANRAGRKVSKSSMREEICVIAVQFRKHVMGKGLGTTPTSYEASRMCRALLAEQKKMNRDLQHAITFDERCCLLGLLVEKARPVLAAVTALVVLVVDNRRDATLRRACGGMKVIVQVLDGRERDTANLSFLMARQKPPTAHHH